MTNGDNGEALMHEILNSVSIEYGWVRDYTYLYAGVTAAIVLALLGILLLRMTRRRCMVQDGMLLAEEGVINLDGRCRRTCPSRCRSRDVSP